MKSFTFIPCLASISTAYSPIDLSMSSAKQSNAYKFLTIESDLTEVHYSILLKSPWLWLAKFTKSAH